MTAVNLASYPYYNDYDSTKGHHQIAFIPGRPIQARELTQMQSILQEQVKRVGNHFFKNGSVIIPGNTYYDNKVFAIRLDQTNALGIQTDSFVASLIGKSITSDSGTTAYVSYAETSSTVGTTFTPAILYVKFMSGGTNGKIEFMSGDVLTDTANSGVSVNVTSIYTPTSAAAIVNITEGVYFANGYFVQVLAQTVPLSNTSNTPTVQVGLALTESIITETDDTTLFDNSVGSSNFSAPGAHRFKIDLALAKRDSTIDYNNIDTTLRVDFILLYNIVAGAIQFEKGSDTEYARFEALLAKRTYEESGDYIINDFNISAIDYRDNIRGNWISQQAFLEGDVVKSNGKNYFCVNSGVSGVTAPSHTVGSVSDGGVDWTFITSTAEFENAGRFKTNYQLGIANPLALEQKADDSFAIEVTGGAAYIQGYRTQINGTKRKVVDKARTYLEEFNIQISAPNPITVFASNLVHGTSVVPVAGLPDISGLGLFNIYTQINGTGSIIGTCRVRSAELVTGGFTDEAFKVSIFDIKITDPKTFGFVYNAVSLKSLTTDCSINLSRRNIPLSGTHASGTAGNASKVYGILSNYDQEMLVNGYITSGNRTDTLYKVSAITSDVEITIQTMTGSAASPAWVSGTPLFISAVAFKAGAVSSITRLPKSSIRTLRSVDINGRNNTNYQVIKQIVQTSTASGGLIYTCPPGENLSPANNLICIATTQTMLAFSESWISSDGTTLTIPNGALLNNTSYKLHLRIAKSGIAAAERTKILRTKTVYVFDSGVYSDAGATALLSWVPSNDKTNGYTSKSAINLGYADIVRINSIRMSAAPTWQETVDLIPIDVKNRFSFDNGQRPEIYDFGHIISNLAPATAPLEVSFDYFEHTAGDYFTVDSYQNTPYSMIPLVGINGSVYNLRDCIDFRIRVNDLDTNSTFYAVGNTLQSNSSFVFDYSYYLGRKDVLLIKAGGELVYKYGTPAINPDFPIVEQMDGMVVAKIEVLPYTNNAEREVGITKLGVRNYTMQDIGKINARLHNVETYVQLSLLEKNTANYKITDKYGLDRLKNGFFVVDFKDNAVHFNSGDYQAPDYRCTILADFSAMIPNRVSLDAPVIVDTNGTFAGSVGTSLGMSVYPNFITTLTPNVNMVEFSMKGIPTNTNPLFSTKVNVNPFNAFSYFGTAAAYPSIDTWQTSTISSETLYTDGNVISNSFNVAAASLANTWTGILSNSASIAQNILNGTITNVTGSETTRTISGSSGGETIITENTTIDANFGWAGGGAVRVDSQSFSVGNTWSNISSSTSTKALSQSEINTALLNGNTSSITGGISGIGINNTTLTNSAISLMGSGTDKFVRSRVFVVVAKGLLPKVNHKLYFDNIEHNSGNFEIKQPIVFNITTTANLEPKLKFYDEVSTFTNAADTSIVTPNKTSGMFRSFSEWSGNDYEGAINGKLVRFGGNYGLLAGWEKTATGYTAYVFPTSPFNSAYSLSGTVSLELLTETNAGSTYNVSVDTTISATIGTAGWTSTSQHPITTANGNLFVLVKLRGSYFRTGQKAISIDRDPLSSVQTFAPGNYTESLNTTKLNNAFANIDNSVSAVTSNAVCSYTATGNILMQKETFTRRLNFNVSANVNTNGVTIDNSTSEWRTRTVQGTFTEINLPSPRVDPLAQSFVIKKTETVNTEFVMIGGITLWFATIPSGTDHKLFVDIITTNNGYPTSMMAHPWARIELLPKDITVASAANNYASQFCKFKVPVPIKTNVEYAIRIIAATSNGYEMWTSQIGKNSVNGGAITAQEADGSLFTSQNGSTWTADQYSDLAAKLHLYNYDSAGKSATMKLRTDLGNGVAGYNGSIANMSYGCSDNYGISAEFRTLSFHPFGCNGINNKIKVYHPRHSVYSSAKGKAFVKLVCISTATTDDITNAIIPLVSGFFFVAEEVKPNSYTLDLTTRYYYDTSTKTLVSNATPTLGTILTNAKKRWGANLWIVQAAGKFDLIKLNADVLLQPNGTTVEFTKKITYVDDNGIHIDNTFDRIEPKADIATNNQFVTFMSGELKANIASGDSDYTLVADESEHGINFRCHTSTANKWVTPIIDLQTLSVSFGKNMHMKHNETDCVVNTTDFVSVLNESCIFSSSDNSVIIPITSNLITSFAIGGVLGINAATATKSITGVTWTTGFATYDCNANGFLVGDSVTITGISPTGYNGTYIITSVATNTFTVAIAANPGDFISSGTNNAIRTSVNNGTYTISDIDLTTRKIKVIGVLATETVTANLSMGLEYISEQNATGGTSQSKFITREVMLAATSTSLHITTAMTTPFGSDIELWYRAGMDRLNNTTWTKKSINLIQTNDGSSFYDNTIEINNIPEFTRFQCKFIFTSTSHFSSGIKDLRIVALL